MVPDYAQPVAEILRLNGYNTGAFGKWHETPGRETTAAGPQTRWPTRQGFEKFYGFVGAEDNMWEPTIHDGVTVVDAPKKDRYHFTEDMTEQPNGCSPVRPNGRSPIWQVGRTADQAKGCLAAGCSAAWPFHSTAVQSCRCLIHHGLKVWPGKSVVGSYLFERPKTVKNIENLKI